MAALALTTATVQPAHAETTTPPAASTAGSSLGEEVDGLGEAVGIVAATGLVAGGFWWLSQQPHIKNALRAAFPNTVYYENCAAVRAAGKTLIYPNDPGYWAGLDRDNDGIGCEDNE